MNIFRLHDSPHQAAYALCDQHVLKMYIESAQLLSAAADRCGVYDPEHMYKITHRSHPCTIWLADSACNVKWLNSYAASLALRMSINCKLIPEKTFDVTRNTADALLDLGVYTDLGLVVPQVMPEQYQILGQPVEAYRRYYKAKNEEWTAKGRPMKWSGSTMMPVSFDY